jgi:hypothetical protein
MTTETREERALQNARNRKREKAFVKKDFRQRVEVCAWIHGQENPEVIQRICEKYTVPEDKAKRIAILHM